MTDDRPTTSAEAYEIQLDEGCAVLFLEGLGSKAEAAGVCRELARYLDRQVGRRGERHILVAVPPGVRLRVARGREIKLQATADNRVVLQVNDGRENGGEPSLIVHPKRW